MTLGLTTAGSIVLRWGVDMLPSRPRLSLNTGNKGGWEDTNNDVKMRVNAREADNSKDEDFQKVPKAC